MTLYDNYSTFDDTATTPIPESEGPTVLYIEDVAMPTPAYNGYTTKKEELVKAERNVGSSLSITTLQATVEGLGKGYLIKRHIAWKYTIEIDWKGLSADQKTLIMNATGTVNESSGFGIANYDQGMKVMFLDLDTGEFLTKRMYRGSDVKISGYGKYSTAMVDSKLIGSFDHYDIHISLIEL